MKKNKKQLQSNKELLRISNVQKIIMTAESHWAQQFWKKILKSFKKRNGGDLFCQVCRINPNKMFGLENDLPILDVHHLKPLSEIGQVKTPKMRDFAVLCPTCHRAIHKLEDCSNIDALISRLNSNNTQGLPL